MRYSPGVVAYLNSIEAHNCHFFETMARDISSFCLYIHGFMRHTLCPCFWYSLHFAVAVQARTLNGFTFAAPMCAGITEKLKSKNQSSISNSFLASSEEINRRKITNGR